MDLNYLRLFVYWRLMHPFSRWARKRRMSTFLKRMSVLEGMSMLNLGVTHNSGMMYRSPKSDDPKSARQLGGLPTQTQYSISGG